MIDFRSLFEMITADQVDDIGDAALSWLDAHKNHAAWLADFGSRQGDPIPEATQDELWELYALSRVNEIMLLHFAPDRGFDSWSAPPVSMNTYLEFMSRLGMSAVEEVSFSPFFHEIVHVDQADDPDSPIRLTEGLWPSFMLGPMLFSRGGVRIEAGRNRIDKSVAETSMLFWAYTRRNRPCQDLSHGWGHNSQWRTGFRRDYRFADMTFLNVDAQPDSDDDESDLTVEERAELLFHRCFVTCKKPGADCFPYDETGSFPSS